MLKTAVFIDGSNMFMSTRQLGFDIDYRKLAEFIDYNDEGSLVGLYYYTAIWEDEQGNKKIQRIVDFLGYNGYTVVSKPATSNETRIKGNMDVELAVDMYRLARRVDRMYLFSGDGDFTYLVQEIQKLGVWVCVISAKDLASNKLIKQANQFLDLKDILPTIGNPHITD